MRQHIQKKQAEDSYLLRGIKKDFVPINEMCNKKFVIGTASTALAYATILGCHSISYEKEKLNNIFGWDEIGVYKFFGIHKVNNFIKLEYKIGKLININ